LKGELQLIEKEEEEEKEGDGEEEKKAKREKEFQADSYLARSATKADRVATVPVDSRSRRASITPNETSRG
jgi:hypothetical protein